MNRDVDLTGLGDGGRGLRIDTRAQGAPVFDMSPVSPARMRTVTARFATGVVVVTVGGEHFHGMTANAFASVSLEPPLVLCCVSRTAVMHQAITTVGRFAFSVLAANQEKQARYFADKKRPLGVEQFDAVDWSPGPLTGAPLLSGALAWLECGLRAAYEAGDHSVFIGEVLASHEGEAAAGLLFVDGKFRRILPPA